MELKERMYNGVVLNGFLALFLHLLVYPAVVGLTLFALKGYLTLATSLGFFFFFGFIILMVGYISLEPNEARVMIYFGKYVGTFKRTGFYWVNPLMQKKRLSLRARNLDVQPIKVNDKMGNPILIGLVLVWKLKDTYRAMFDIDAQIMAEKGNAQPVTVVGRMNAFQEFVKVQSDAALRQVAGEFAYDDPYHESDELTLRGEAGEINEQLIARLNERLAIAGMEIVDARINSLAYAPEIAAVMLRRQQAGAIITAREKIVEGAVGMVKKALDKLERERVALNEEQKAVLVSNLMVVLCSEEQVKPVVNTDRR